MLDQKQAFGMAERWIEVRPIWSEAGYLPGPTALHYLPVGTINRLQLLPLGTKLDAQLIDGAIFNYDKKFLLHYNFPSFQHRRSKNLRAEPAEEKLDTATWRIVL